MKQQSHIQRKSSLKQCGWCTCMQRNLISPRARWIFLGACADSKCAMMDGMDLSDFSKKEQEEFTNFMTDQQLKDSQRTFNTISQKCFNSCVTGFRNRSLDKTEKNCMTSCTSRFLTMINRAGMRFAEQNQPPPQ